MSISFYIHSIFPSSFTPFFYSHSLSSAFSASLPLPFHPVINYFFPYHISPLFFFLVFFLANCYFASSLLFLCVQIICFYVTLSEFVNFFVICKCVWFSHAFLFLLLTSPCFDFLLLYFCPFFNTFPSGITVFFFMLLLSYS